eukprot:CAMPEP_0195284832 /NCGR_PEP_ID=MMETSP0707-20130614/2895_1 /TAXON_ID=33640 /ORGANISM="Asterionellopsis glacialis, Strain CCMP134" /LENGTH=425 /DNA_ID=CAMNT_0040344233 /DNA_START=119 /DNA_END=1396 /DNA_ORIENTATION=-
MKFIITIASLASLSLSLSSTTKYGLCHAFVLPSKSTTTPRFGLHGTKPNNAGGGIPVVEPGNLQLYDPDLEGLLQGTGQLSQRVQQGANYQPSAPVSVSDSDSVSDKVSPATTAATPVMEAQHWLEDIGIPQNFAKPNNPVQATVLGRTSLITPDAPGDIQHIIMKLPEGMHYIEGQSLSVIPPGKDALTGRAHKPRLYSIASTRYGDILNGNTISLCVRRAEYWDPVAKRIDPSKAGVCSNYLCDILPGTQVNVAGPVGKTMVLPDDPTTDIIMVATGTGIAPFRGFLHRLFMEQTLARHQFTGTAWLILGVPTTGGLLYQEELKAMQQNAAPLHNLKIDYAISREMTNTVDGGKLYVQHVLQQQSQELWDRLDKGAQIYFCGLKGMMPGIVDALEQVAISRGEDWSAKLQQLKENHQWHVEVY